MPHPLRTISHFRPPVVPSFSQVFGVGARRVRPSYLRFVSNPGRWGTERERMTAGDFRRPSARSVVPTVHWAGTFRRPGPFGTIRATIWPGRSFRPSRCGGLCILIGETPGLKDMIYSKFCFTKMCRRLACMSSIRANTQREKNCICCFVARMGTFPDTGTMKTLRHQKLLMTHP